MELHFSYRIFRFICKLLFIENYVHISDTSMLLRQKCFIYLWGQWKYWQAQSWTTGPKILIVEPGSWCFCLPIFLSISWSVIEWSQVALLRAKLSWKHGHLLPGVIGSVTCQSGLLFHHCHVTWRIRHPIYFWPVPFTLFEQQVKMSLENGILHRSWAFTVSGKTEIVRDLLGGEFHSFSK